MKRKNEKDVAASANKRRKTTSNIPVTPKPKQTPKKVVRRRKTVSSLAEDPVITPMDAAKFFDARARFIFSSSLFKDADYPITLRYGPPNEAVMITKPEKVKPKKNSR